MSAIGLMSSESVREYEDKDEEGGRRIKEERKEGWMSLCWL